MSVISGKGQQPPVFISGGEGLTQEFQLIQSQPLSSNVNVIAQDVGQIFSQIQVDTDGGLYMILINLTLSCGDLTTLISTFQVGVETISTSGSSFQAYDTIFQNVTMNNSSGGFFSSSSILFLTLPPVPIDKPIYINCFYLIPSTGNTSYLRFTTKSRGISVYKLL